MYELFDGEIVTPRPGGWAWRALRAVVHCLLLLANRRSNQEAECRTGRR